MTPEEYVRNMQIRDNDEQAARDHHGPHCDGCRQLGYLADRSTAIAAEMAAFIDRTQPGLLDDLGIARDPWGTCKHCGCATDGGRNCCSDCYPKG